MTNIFLVIGSVADPHRAREAGDIDLVVPEFTDDRMYTSAVDLEPYEKAGPGDRQADRSQVHDAPIRFELNGLVRAGRALAI